MTGIHRHYSCFLPDMKEAPPNTEEINILFSVGDEYDLFRQCNSANEFHHKHISDAVDWEDKRTTLSEYAGKSLDVSWENTNKEKKHRRRSSFNDREELFNDDGLVNRHPYKDFYDWLFWKYHESMYCGLSDGRVLEVPVGYTSGIVPSKDYGGVRKVINENLENPGNFDLFPKSSTGANLKQYTLLLQIDPRNILSNSPDDVRRTTPLSHETVSGVSNYEYPPQEALHGGMGGIVGGSNRISSLKFTSADRSDYMKESGTNVTPCCSVGGGNNFGSTCPYFIHDPNFNWEEPEGRYEKLGDYIPYAPQPNYSFNLDEDSYDDRLLSSEFIASWYGAEDVFDKFSEEDLRAFAWHLSTTNPPPRTGPYAGYTGEYDYRVRYGKTVPFKPTHHLYTGTTGDEYPSLEPFELEEEGADVVDYGYIDFFRPSEELVYDKLKYLKVYEDDAVIENENEGFHGDIGHILDVTPDTAIALGFGGPAVSDRDYILLWHFKPGTWIYHWSMFLKPDVDSLSRVPSLLGGEIRGMQNIGLSDNSPIFGVMTGGPPPPISFGDQPPGGDIGQGGQGSGQYGDEEFFCRCMGDLWLDDPDQEGDPGWITWGGCCWNDTRIDHPLNEYNGDPIPGGRKFCFDNYQWYMNNFIDQTGFMEYEDRNYFAKCVCKCIGSRDFVNAEFYPGALGCAYNSGEIDDAFPNYLENVPGDYWEGLQDLRDGGIPCGGQHKVYPCDLEGPTWWPGYGDTHYPGFQYESPILANEGFPDYRIPYMSAEPGDPSFSGWGGFGPAGPGFQGIDQVTLQETAIWCWSKKENTYIERAWGDFPWHECSWPWFYHRETMKFELEDGTLTSILWPEDYNEDIADCGDMEAPYTKDNWMDYLGDCRPGILDEYYERRPGPLGAANAYGTSGLDNIDLTPYGGYSVALGNYGPDPALNAGRDYVRADFAPKRQYKFRQWKRYMEWIPWTNFAPVIIHHIERWIMPNRVENLKKVKVHLPRGHISNQFLFQTFQSLHSYFPHHVGDYQLQIKSYRPGGGCDTSGVGDISNLVIDEVPGVRDLWQGASHPTGWDLSGTRKTLNAYFKEFYPNVEMEYILLPDELQRSYVGISTPAMIGSRYTPWLGNHIMHTCTYDQQSEYNPTCLNFLDPHGVCWELANYVLPTGIDPEDDLSLPNIPDDPTDNNLFTFYSTGQGYNQWPSTGCNMPTYYDDFGFEDLYPCQMYGWNGGSRDLGNCLWEDGNWQFCFPGSSSWTFYNATRSCSWSSGFIPTIRDLFSFFYDKYGKEYGMTDIGQDYLGATLYGWSGVEGTSTTFEVPVTNHDGQTSVVTVPVKGPTGASLWNTVLGCMGSHFTPEHWSEYFGNDDGEFSNWMDSQGFDFEERSQVLSHVGNGQMWEPIGVGDDDDQAGTSGKYKIPLAFYGMCAGPHISTDDGAASLTLGGYLTTGGICTPGWHTNFSILVSPFYRSSWAPYRSAELEYRGYLKRAYPTASGSWYHGFTSILPNWPEAVTLRTLQWGSISNDPDDPFDVLDQGLDRVYFEGDVIGGRWVPAINSILNTDPNDLIENPADQGEYDVKFFLETLMNPVPRQQYDLGDGWSDYPTLNWEDGRTLIGGCGPLDDPYPCIEKYQYPYTNTKDVQENGLIRESPKFLSKTSSNVTGKSVQLRKGKATYSSNYEAYGYPTNRKRRVDGVDRIKINEGDIDHLYTKYYYNGVPIDVPEGYKLRDDIIP